MPCYARAPEGTAHMGTWSIPWEDDDTAARFTARMAEPWMAEITLGMAPEYGPEQPGDDNRLEDGVWRRYRRQGLLRRWKPVTPIGEKETVDWDAPDLYGLCGDDELFDDLIDEARRVREPFDVRPFVAKRLREVFEEFAGCERDELADEAQLPALDAVRAAVGLPPLEA